MRAMFGSNSARRSQRSASAEGTALGRLSERRRTSNRTLSCERDLAPSFATPHIGLSQGRGKWRGTSFESPAYLSAAAGRLTDHDTLLTLRDTRGGSRAGASARMLARACTQLTCGEAGMIAQEARYGARLGEAQYGGELRDAQRSATKIGARDFQPRGNEDFREG